MLKPWLKPCTASAPMTCMACETKHKQHYTPRRTPRPATGRSSRITARARHTAAHTVHQLELPLPRCDWSSKNGKLAAKTVPKQFHVHVCRLARGTTPTQPPPQRHGRHPARRLLMLRLTDAVGTRQLTVDSPPARTTVADGLRVTRNRRARRQNRAKTVKRGFRRLVHLHVQFTALWLHVLLGEGHSGLCNGR